MNLTLHDAIIAALCYANIFDYPLTEEEVRTWLPYVRNYPRQSLKKIYSSFHPTRRLFEIRKKREAWSIDKWTRAQWIANLLKHIPTIMLIGVTGGLTRSNVRASDDIDFFIITASKTMWMTRALSTILLDILHLRRRPGDTNVRDLVCLNMFMSVNGLAIPQKERDLFTAHEVLLMTPLWERDNTYSMFLRANTWVRKFLPNAWEEKVKSSREAGSRSAGQKSKVKSQKSYKAFSIFEPIARFIQLRYMRKRQTSEVVSDKVIRFHPRDARVWIKRDLGERLMRFNVPLDKIFYGR
ncbi:MAG: hypothetical protein AAB481_00820 [Patescibacteria group bacterium]